MASRGSMIKMDSKYLLKSSFLSALSIFLGLSFLSLLFLRWLHLTTSMWFQALASRGALPAPALVSPRSYREAQGSCAVVVVQWSAEAADFGKVSIIPSVPMSVHCPLNRACQCQLSSGAFHGISDLAISGAIACDFGQVLFTIFFLKKQYCFVTLKTFQFS